MTESEGKAPIIVPLSKKDGTRATTPITCSWWSLACGALWADAVIPAGGAWGKPRSGQAWPLGAFVAIDQRWPDIETQPNGDIPKPQVQKTMQRHEITVTKAVVI